MMGKGGKGGMMGKGGMSGMMGKGGMSGMMGKGAGKGANSDVSIGTSFGTIITPDVWQTVNVTFIESSTP
jgi:hypothetical protein